MALPLPEDRPLRIAVVADTHSRPHPKAAAHLRAHAPDAILHGGDIGALQVLEDLRQVAPVIAVRGNIDARADGVPDSVDLTLGGGEGPTLRLLLTHIAVAGPRLRADAARLAERHQASLVVCGHSHVPFIGRDRGLTVFNPGSVGPRRFALPITFGMLMLGREGLTLAHIDCESGEPWLPA